MVNLRDLAKLLPSARLVSNNTRFTQVSAAASSSFAASAVPETKHTYAAVQTFTSDQTSVSYERQICHIRIAEQAQRILAPNTSSVMSKLFHPYVEQHKQAIAAAEGQLGHERTKQSTQSLLALPDSALELISMYMLPGSSAKVQMTCRHMRDLLDDRFWQCQIEDLHPAWIASGAAPCNQHAKTWKQLAEASCALQRMYSIDIAAQDFQKKLTATKQLWNEGKHVQLDLHLCSVEEESKQAMLGQPTQPHLKMMYISTLLDMVFFFWFEQQQLARGATMLAKAVSLLAGLVSNNSRRQLWFGTSDLAIFTAAAASFLVDLLDMKMANETVMAYESPHNLLWWCEGKEGWYTPEYKPKDGTFQWFGSGYSCDDLNKALAVLSGHTSFHVTFEGGRVAANWRYPLWRQAFNSDAVHLLDTIAWIPEEGQMEVIPGTALLHQAQQLASQQHLSPFEACRCHQLFAGAGLLFRIFEVDDLMVVESHGAMFGAASQHQRRAYLAKRQLMQTRGSLCAAGQIAEAYYQDWAQTGRLESMCRAYAWQKCIIMYILQLRAWGLKICTDLCLSLLSSLILLLQSNDSFRGCILDLKGGDSDFLIIGACITALDLSDDDADSLTTWLKTHVKVADGAKCLFKELIDYQGHTSKCRRCDAMLLQQPAPAAPAWGIPPAFLTMQQASFVTHLGHALLKLRQHIAGQCLLTAAAHFVAPPLQ